MEITAQQDPWLLHWAQAQLRVSWEPGSVRWLSGIVDGAPRFVVVYSRFSARACELTIATDGAKRWASKKSLRAIFWLPFMQWNLARCTFVVAADNPVSIDLCERLGAVREGVIRKAFADDVDAVVLGLLKEECIWC